MIQMIGHFQVVTSGPAGIRRQAFRNVLLDTGKLMLCERLLEEDAWQVGRYLFWGTGETEPSPSDSGLEARHPAVGKIAASHSFASYSDSARGERRADCNLVFEFGEGELTGEWTEFGLAADDEYTQPLNRALVRDENGAATSLIVMSDEAATIYVTLRLVDGVRFPRPVEISIDGTHYECELTPVDTGMWSSSGRSPWDKGFAHATAMLLDDDGDRWDFRTPPWPADPPDSLAYAIASTNYERDSCRQNFVLAIPPSAADMLIRRIGFTSLSDSDCGYQLRLLQPITKPITHTLTFTFSITLM